MRISDLSSEVCSSDLAAFGGGFTLHRLDLLRVGHAEGLGALDDAGFVEGDDQHLALQHLRLHEGDFLGLLADVVPLAVLEGGHRRGRPQEIDAVLPALRSEERRVGQDSVSTVRYRWSPYN